MCGLDAEMRHGVDEALVQLRRPHQAWPLEDLSRLVAAAAAARNRRRASAAVVVDVRAAARTPGAPHRATTSPTAVLGDVEGDDEIRRDERLRERHQLIWPGGLGGGCDAAEERSG